MPTNRTTYITVPKSRLLDGKATWPLLVDESSLVVGMVVVGVSVVAGTGTGALVGELLMGVRVVGDAASKV